MATPMQRRILDLITLAGGLTTLSHIIAETKSNYIAIDPHLRKMTKDGLINRSSGNVWMTMRGMAEYETLNERKCLICDNRHVARGYCESHYRKWKRGTL